MAESREPSWTITARYILPIDAPPIANGTLTIAGDRIVAVDPPGVQQPDHDFGHVAVLPGLVNAHTHLDLCGLRGQLAAGVEFKDWLKLVVAYRRSSSTVEWQRAVRGGIAECLRSGTTLVGDISAGGFSAGLLAGSPLRAIVFFELIGLTKERAKQAWQAAREWLDKTAEPVLGLSPHAPYTVRRSLFRAAFRKSQAGKLPLAIHFAETREEYELLATQGGPFRAFLESLNAWDQAGLAPSLEWIMEMSQAAHRVLFIHGNYLEPELLKRLGKHPAASIIYCPRTHARFGHNPHPIAELLARRIPVALGTDSLASNPDLSMLEEMRFLAQHRPDLDKDTILCLGTLAGAKALGRDADLGSLTPGKLADWITVPLSDATRANPLEELLLGNEPVQDVYISGRRVETLD